MATIFEVAKQSQNSQPNQSQTEPQTNQTPQHFANNCVTNGLFLFNEPSNSINMLDNWLLPSKQSRSSLEAAKRELNPNQSSQFHSIDTGTDQIDLLSTQQHFQFQHPQHPQHQHSQTHSLFLSPTNMDSQITQQQSLQQPQQPMQQTDQLQTSPNCSFGE